MHFAIFIPVCRQAGCSCHEIILEEGVSMAKKALGKGLEALIPLKEKEMETEISVDEIYPNKYQPRERFNTDKLKDLIASIKEKGIVQPVLVRRVAQGYELIAGERRWRAAKELGLKKIPIVIRDVSKEETIELSLIENIQREDLNPLEEAQAYKRLIGEFKITQENLAKRISRERSSIANTLRLLNLPQEIQDDISQGLISPGHARALLSLKGKREQIKVNERIKRKGFSVRETENLIKRLKKKIIRKKSFRKDTQIIEVEEELMRILGTKVKITPKRNKGKIEIEYYSFADLERILEILKSK